MPADGTLLTALDGSGVVITHYVVFGGARFEIPAAVMVDMKTFLELGYTPGRFCNLFASTLVWIPTVAQDGTLLKELHSGTVYMMDTGTRRPITSWDNVRKHPFFAPELGVLWDRALDSIPIGQPV